MTNKQTKSVEEVIDNFKTLYPNGFKDVDGNFMPEAMFNHLARILTTLTEQAREEERDRIKKWAIEQPDYYIERTGMYSSSAVLLEDLLQALNQNQG